MDNNLHEECGVFAAYSLSGEDVAAYIYYGLFALQHRGQESAGISVSDTGGEKGNICSVKGMGLVNEVFDKKNLETLKGNLGVGHVRYSTTGASIPSNIQPLAINYIKGTLGLAHNGNLVNAAELKQELSYTGAIFQSTIDTEVIAYLIARERINTKNVESAVLNAMKKLKGAYSLVIMSPRKLIGARDPFGFRPLVLGKKDDTYFFASETCALDAVKAEYVRDVEPGEVVTIYKDKVTGETVIESDKTLCSRKHAHCIFEYIYFARADSVIDGISVYDSRVKAGKILAQEHPAEADVVVGVPNSGLIAAYGYSMESKIPYCMGFEKNSYVGRTFIKPSQTMREAGVMIKLNAIKQAVNGKRVVMIDDSIVRGTTSAQIVKLLRDAGATEVHVRISSPEFLFPCYFGTDVPSSKELVATGKSVEEICKIIGADSLGYFPNDRLNELIEKTDDFCDACFSGNYPEAAPKHDIRNI